MLSQFLTDIGAATLSPAVDLPATTEDTPPFAALHDRLTQEITSINDQTRQLLEQNWSDFQEQVADGKELLVRMEEEETELTELEGELAGDRAFLPSLVERLTAHSKLAQTHSLANHTLTLINSLLALHTAIATVSNHTTAGSLPLAVASLRELQSALTRGAEPWIEHTDAWNALRRWAADEQIRLEGAVAGALEGCFEFSPTTTTAGTTLALRSSIAAAPRGEELSVPVLLQALEDVFVMGGAGKKVDAQLARVSKQLLKYFVVPFLETNGRPDSDGKLDIVYAEERGAWTATIRPRTTVSSSAEEEGADSNPLKEIATLLTFFATHTHLFPPSPYAANFTANLTPTIQALVIASHLAPSLPNSIDLIPPYLNTLAAASTFESSFLATSGYFAFLPKESHGQMREEGKVIQSWVERVAKHWAGKVGDGALEKVREEIVRGEWEGEMRSVEVQVEGDGGRMRTVKEEMLVSSRSGEIVKAAEKVLDRAVAVGAPAFPHPTFAPASPLLLRTFISILSLYRATVPVRHSAVLSTVPAIGVQFANDTDWISTEVERLWRRSKSGQTSEGDADVEQALETTKRMGRDWREKLISIQRDLLMDSLDEANRFLYTADDARYAACERALSQITHTLERLSQVWKPVMNPTAFFSTLGNLVNDVLQRVLDEIMEQIDISEEESIRLNKLCKMLHGLEELFEGDVTSVGIEVPVWFKFVFLSELLEASMADILFLFNDGHLVDFEPADIAKLVRALFSDSSLRNRNLEHILKGHPNVLPGQDDTDDSRAPSPAPPPPPRAPRTPSPPPAPVMTTRSGRQPLGTRLVNAKPSTPSPPPTPPPPPREPTPPPRASSPIVAQTPEIDPELSASFDDVPDEAWGFSSPEGSPIKEEVALHEPSPEREEVALPAREVESTPSPQLDATGQEDAWGFSPEASPASEVEALPEPSPAKGEVALPEASPVQEDAALPEVPVSKVDTPPTAPHAALVASPPPPPPRTKALSPPPLVAAALPLAAATSPPAPQPEPQQPPSSVGFASTSRSPTAAVEPSPFAHDDDSAAALFLGSPPSIFDNLGPAPSALDELGGEPVPEPEHVEPVAEQGKHEDEEPSMAERPASPSLVAFEQEPESSGVTAEHVPQLESEGMTEEEEHASDLAEALALVEEERAVVAAEEEQPSPIVHAEHTATIVHEEQLGTQGEEEEADGWDLEEKVHDEQLLEHEQEMSSFAAAEEEQSQAEHAEPGHVEEAHSPQFIEDVAEVQSLPPPNRSPSPPAATRSPSPPPIARSPSPPAPRSPSPPAPAHVDESSSPEPYTVMMGAQEGHVTVGDVDAEASTSPIFATSTLNDDRLAPQHASKETAEEEVGEEQAPVEEEEVPTFDEVAEPAVEEEEESAFIEDVAEPVAVVDERSPSPSPTGQDEPASFVEDAPAEAVAVVEDHPRSPTGDDAATFVEDVSDPISLVDERDTSSTGFDEHPSFIEDVSDEPNPIVEERAPSLSHLDEDGPIEPSATLGERPSSPAGLGSSPEMVEHASPITSPELVDSVPLSEDDAQARAPASEAPLEEERPEVETIPVAEVVELAPAHVAAEEEVEPAQVGAGEHEDVEGAGWSLGGEEEIEQMDEEERIEDAEEAEEAEAIAPVEETSQAPVVEPPQQRAPSPSPVPTPPSPLLSPVVDSEPIPTPLQQATPPTAPSPSLVAQVATPAHELHLDDEPFVRPEVQQEPTGDHDSPALVPEASPERVDEEHKVLEAAQEDVAAEPSAGGEGDGVEEEEESWGFDDELEGLEEAAEDEPYVPIAYTPISPPRPLPYALPISPPPLPRPAPPPVATNGRHTTPIKAPAPLPRAPSFFSPTKVAPTPAPETGEEEEEEGDGGWGFDEEEEGGLGYMDDSPNNEAEELAQDLYSAPSETQFSPPKRNGHKAKQESVGGDDDAWGF